MNYKIIRINTAAKNAVHSSVLIIYTGGTLGMAYDESIVFECARSLADCRSNDECALILSDHISKLVDCGW